MEKFCTNYTEDMEFFEYTPQNVSVDPLANGDEISVVGCEYDPVTSRD